MEEGADNPNGSQGGGLDFLDPRKPGYLARTRFRPSLRTRLPRFEGSRYPRPVWPRFSSLRRYVPVSVVTGIGYVFLLRIMFLLWGLLFTETTMVLFWRTPIAVGVSLLGWFEIVNVAFIVWVGLDFRVSLRDRCHCGLSQKVGYVAALVLLGALQFAYNRLDYANDYLHVLAVLDDQDHPSLMLRIPPEQEPDANQPMTFEQCPVGLALLDADPNWDDMYVYSFFRWQSQGPDLFKRPADPNWVTAMDLPAELRSRAAAARPPWLFIDPTRRSDLSWTEMVELCDDAFKAGFERVLLRESKSGFHASGGVVPTRRPGWKDGVYYHVAEVLPVQPTRWKQGTGPEREGKSFVRVWVCKGGMPWGGGRLPSYTIPPLPHPIRIGPEQPPPPWYWADEEGEISSWGPYTDVKRMQEAVRKEMTWRHKQIDGDLVLWIWADAPTLYSDIAPLVDLVRQKRWDPNRP